MQKDPEFQHYFGKELRITTNSGAIYEGTVSGVRGSRFCLTKLRIVNKYGGTTTPKGWKKGKPRGEKRWFNVKDVFIVLVLAQ